MQQYLLISMQNHKKNMDCSDKPDKEVKEQKQDQIESAMLEQLSGLREAALDFMRSLQKIK